MKTNGGFYISQIKQMQDRIFERLLHRRNININGSQGRILFVLWKEDNLSLKEIGKRTSLKNNTLSSVIDRMIEKDFLYRESNPDNRREVIISLTNYTKSLEAEYHEVSDEMAEIFYENFTDDEITDFEKHLEKILINLKIADDKKGELK